MGKVKVQNVLTSTTQLDKTCLHLCLSYESSVDSSLFSRGTANILAKFQSLRFSSDSRATFQDYVLTEPGELSLKVWLNSFTAGMY